VLDKRVGDAVTFALAIGAVRSALRIAVSWRRSNSVMRKLAFGRADQRSIHQFEYGAFAESMRASRAVACPGRTRGSWPCPLCSLAPGEEAPYGRPPARPRRPALPRSEAIQRLVQLH